MSDDDMTAEEFDRRLAEATPVDVTVNLGRTYTRTVAAQPAPVPSDPDVTPSLDDFLHEAEEENLDRAIYESIRYRQRARAAARQLKGESS